METIGLEAVVTGLLEFGSDMESIQKYIEGVSPSTTILGQAFESLTGFLGDMGDAVVHVAEYAIGGLLKDAIEGAVKFVGDLISATVDAGNQFQTLELRLRGLNLNDAIASGESYNQATQTSIDLTKEQLDWLQKIAVTTPYDNTDISNIYTLARSYGFANDESQTLVQSVTDFASGMGLDSTAIERVITNLGQMVQQGKITRTELRDLARGAFVPVADVLEQVRQNLQASGSGMKDYSGDIAEAQQKLDDYKAKLAIAIQKQSEFTDSTAESTRMANSLTIEKLQRSIAETETAITGFTEKMKVGGEISKETFDAMMKDGIPAQEFIKAFEQVTGERFAGASIRMGRTFEYASRNALDMVKSIGGLDVVKPVLDVIGGKIADLINQFAQGANFDRLTEAASRVGQALADIVDRILGLAPGAGTLADMLIQGMNNFADWLNAHADDFVAWVKNMAAWISEVLIPFIQDSLIPAIASFIGWIVDHKDEIIKFFSDLASWIVDKLAPFITDVLVPAISAFIGWLTDHQEEIIPWLELLAKAFLAFVIIQFVASLVITFVGGLISLITTIVTVILMFIYFGSVIGTVVATLGTIAVVIGALIATFKFFQIAFTYIFTFIADRIVQLATMTIENFNNIRTAIMNGDWWGLGAAIINGITDGIRYNTVDLVSALWDAAQAGMQAFKDALGISSPSKVFAGFGENIMAGVADGISASTGLAVGAMENAVGMMSAPMVQMPAVAASYAVAAPASTSGGSQTNNNFNLSINGSSTSQESIIQDFGMLQSLAGA